MKLTKQIELFFPIDIPRPCVDEPLEFSEHVLVIGDSGCTDIGFYDMIDEEWIWFTDGPEPGSDWMWYYTPADWEDVG